MDADNLLNSLTEIDASEISMWVDHNRESMTDAWLAHGKQQVEALGLGGDLEEGLRLAAKLELVAQTLQNPLSQALVHRAQANILQFNERYEESLEYSGRAADLYAQHGTLFDVAVARTVEVTTLGATERFDEAIELAHWIRPFFEAVDFKLGLARLSGSLAHVYSMAWRLESALPAYQEAHRLYTELDMPLDAAWMVHNMGVLAERRDDLKEARRCYEAAYPVFIEAGDVVMMVKTQFNLAQLCTRQAQYEQALAHLATAREHLTSTPDSPDMGYVDLFEARVRQELGETAASEQLLQKALIHFEQLDRHLEAAEVLVELSQQPAEIPDQVAQALSYLDQAAAHLHHVDVPLFEGWVQLERAERLSQLGRTEEAAALAKKLQKLFAERHLPLRQGQALLIQGDCAKKTQPAMARYYYQQALDLIGHGAPLLAVRCWQGLGDVAADPAVAEAAYERAQTLFDSIRRTLHSHGHQAGFAMQKETLNRALLATLHQQVGQESKLLRWVERSKAAALVDLLREQPVDETLDEKLRDLIEERERLASQIDQRLHRMTVSAPSTATPQRGPQLVAHNRYQRGQIGELRRRLQWVEEQLQRARHPAQTWREGETLATSQIQVQIGREGSLLAYYEAGDQLAAIVVNGQQITARLLNITVDELARQWQQTRRFVQRPQTSLEALHARLGRLYDILLRPLEDLLETSERLLILPHRVLYQIPLAALYDTATTQYVLERWVCYYAPSATVWSWCQQRRTAVDAASLLVGYPGEPDQPDYLPAVREEIEAIAELVPQPRQLFGQDATAAQVMLAMRHKRLVHLAGHAFYDGERPLDSGMPLADGRWLRAADLYLRYGMLDGALVVLSGCETGKGHAAGGEVLGLVSAFLYAGARTILSGLWKVDDAATAELMGRFYEELAAGQDAAVALREAQLVLLRNEKTAAPYFWAPFTINGAGR